MRFQPHWHVPRVGTILARNLPRTALALTACGLRITDTRKPNTANAT